MSNIYQIQFQFLPVEDRLQLKLNTTQQEEYIFLLTRRFVSLLYPILTKILHADNSVNVHKDNLVRNEMVKLQQEGSLKSSDTTSPYKSNELSHPLGSEAILLTNISTQINADNINLSLTPEQGQGISFNIDQKLTHLLRNLLLESLDKTDWQLACQSDYISTTPIAEPDKKILH